MIETLLMPFQFSFMLKGFAIAIIVAIPMALLSCFLVLKGWSLMGDAISHAVFPGVVLGYMAVAPLMAVPFFAAFGVEDVTMFAMAFGAFLAGLFCAVATGFLQANSRIKQDTVMGVVFSGMFGFGLVLFTAIKTDLHLNHILFGHLLGVNWQDIAQTAFISCCVSLVLIVKWRDFLLYCFDPVQSRAVGLKVGFLHYGLLIMISLSIVAALKAVGIILSISLLIAPGATAYLFVKRFSRLLVVAVLIAVFSSFLGVYLSAIIGSDSAATIVLVMTLLFVIAFCTSIIRTRRAQKIIAQQ